MIGRNWKIIRQHIETYTKHKHIVALLYDFLYRFKSHIFFHESILGMDKFEYLSIMQNISHLQDELYGLKNHLQQHKLYLFTDMTKIIKIIETYTGILYLIEKYCSTNIINTINYYLLLYCELVNLYKLYNSHNKQQQKNNKQTISHLPEPQGLLIKRGNAELKVGTGISSSLPTETSGYLAHNSKMANYQLVSDSIICPDNNISNSSDTYSSTEDEMQDTDEFSGITNLNKYAEPAQHIRNCIFDQGVLQPICDVYHNWILKVSKQKYINSFNTLNGTLLRNIYRPNRNINNQYLDLMAKCIKPFEMNIFLMQDKPNINTTQPEIHDLFEELNILKDAGILKTGHLTNINTGISKIYKSIIQKLELVNTQNIHFSTIQNTNILVNIKKYEYIKDNILHVFICIPITKTSKLVFVINGYIKNQDVMITQKYSIISQKYDIIYKQIISIAEMSMAFKKTFVKTITLNQLLCLRNDEIIKACVAKWTLYTTIMAQSISDMITHFLNGNTRKKTEILSCLLCCHKNNESAFRANMLWNLIIDESRNMESTEREIFMRLHPILLIQLNHITSYTDNNTGSASMTATSNDTVTYEKLIAQSNTDTITKQKMYEKLKEFTNKNNDNNSKAQQYLDGILNIPFGKYAKESIICENDKHSHNIKQFLSNLIILCLDYKDNYSACNELLILLVEMFGLNTDIMIKFDNNVDDIETYIFSVLDKIKIKTGILSSLLDIFNKYIHDKLTVSPETLDTTYIITFLSELNPESQQEILTWFTSCDDLFINNQYNTSCATTHLTFDTLVHSLESGNGSLNCYHFKCELQSKLIPKLISKLISFLATESYFYDTGIPAELVKYKDNLVELLEQNKDLIAKKKAYLANCYTQLDKSIYGQQDAKDQIIRIIGQWLNGNQSGYCIGFEGAPGVGKTSLAKYGIANALVDEKGGGRPFGFIALGGSSNGSTLEGHGYTYVGSTWGRIVDIIMTAGVMNPIIFIDELDKISNTESGREIIGILTHITDKTQNMDFMDKYFAGVKIDLSKVLFVFSYNDYSKLDSILADRIHRVKFDNYSVADKIAICNNYLVPNIVNEININDFECVLKPEALRYIIDSYTYEAGVRKLKEKLYDILREINVKYIRGELDGICSSQEKYSDHVTITPEIVDDILNSYYKVEIPQPMAVPMVGVVYGLYATSMGTGGITIIQVTRKYSDSSALVCTGKPGDVMLESMKVALTLAINILEPEILAKWGINHSGDASKFGLHIHCPDGATPKDGPSAGCAFTAALFSLLTDTPVLNTVSMTGEIDILGNVLPIGGLDSKIQGSSRSGINTILVPIDNKKDIAYIQRRQPEILEGITIHYTKTVQDVLKYCLKQ